MNVLELAPNCTGYPEHDHVKDAQEEVYLVLEGLVSLQVGTDERQLSTGDFVHVPADLRRKFVTKESGAVLLAIGGTPDKPYSP
jgi:quercetin dioxygenase-like cupin family protein